MPGVQEPGSLGGAAVGVFDRLCLVKNHAVEVKILEVGDIAPKCAVRRQDKIVVREMSAGLDTING